jgi:hypothetical protein
MGFMIRRLRKDEEGVASTVGTIMALLVFLTFLSLIVNQYVPVWMKDSESAHMNGVLGQFGGMKGSVDLQILGAQIAQDAGTHYIPITTANAVTLGVDGVPIFSAPTVGELTLDPSVAPWTIVFYYDIRGVVTRVDEFSSGAMDLNVANRYFLPQTIVYENGGVIRAQSDGQVVRAPPTFEAVPLNSTLDLSFQLITLYGSGSVAGTTTEVVNTKLFGLDRQDYTDIRSTIWINHTSEYGVAWYQFFNGTLAANLGITSGTFATVETPERILLLEYTARRGLENVYRARVAWDSVGLTYRFVLEIYRTTGLPLGVFRLQHVYVTMGVGESTEEP